MVNDDMARIDRQAVLAEYEAERLRCNNLLERPDGDMRRPTRVFETAPPEVNDDMAARGNIATYNAHTGITAWRVQAVQDLFSPRRVRVFETAPLEVDEDVALVEGTGRIRDATAADLGHYAALYAELCAEQVRCPYPFDMRWAADAMTGKVDYEDAVSKDSTIEEMWAKMEALGIMRD